MARYTNDVCIDLAVVKHTYERNCVVGAFLVCEASRLLQGPGEGAGARNQLFVIGCWDFVDSCPVTPRTIFIVVCII
jgi:hypothetical protein